MKILVIEDERELREVIASSLRQAHFVVEEAATLVGARTKVATYEYDCILLDQMLPDGNLHSVLPHSRPSLIDRVGPCVG